MIIFEFANYRDFLRNYVRKLPKRGYGELSKIAAHLAINTTLLSQILGGHRHLNTDQACELGEYLGLTEIELDYLYLLVEIERAGSHKNKIYLKKRMEKIRAEASLLSKRVQHEHSLTEEERSHFYSSWIFAAVQLFSGTNKKGVDLEEICQRFGLNRTRGSEVLHFLLKAGLCKEVGGKFLPGTQSTFIEHGSPHLLKHHSNWRLKALQRSEFISKEELMFTAPLSLSKKDFASIRERIIQFIQEIAKTVEVSESEDLANFNIDWVWIDRN